MKLMILDGNSIVNRAYYGIRMLNAPDGTPTNGVYGFFAILHKLLGEEKPDALCVAFDLAAPTFRHERYEGYKARRKPMPEDLAVQMPVLKEALDAMGVLRLELPGFEADDLIGTVAKSCEKEGAGCVIVTGDKDSFQLITGTTTVKHVRSRMGQTETTDYTAEHFREEYGFDPIRMIDLKALMGDPSDNIPGVPGVGEKTAMELISRFGSLEGVYANLDSPEIKDGVRKKLAEGKESAALSFELATIDTGAPIAFSPEDAGWSGVCGPGLYGVFKRLGFEKFISQWGLREAEGETPPAAALEPRREEIGDGGQFERMLSDLKSAAAVAVFAPNGPGGLELSAGGTLYLLQRDAVGEGYDGFLRELFSSDLKFASHNVKDLMSLLLDEGLEADSFVFDTALAAYLLDATAGSYELPRISARYLGREAHGAEAVFALAPVLRSRLRELGMERLYCDIELPLCHVLAEMERAGFLVDKKALSDFGESLNEGIESLQRSIWELAGAEFNINSPKQLGEVLFDKLMLPAGKKTKTGWSTNADVLERLRGRHDIIQQILDYRELAKLKSTYADGLLKVIGPDGRIHTSFQMTATATGRLSSTEPNLQNIPIRRELGGEIRKMFVAPPGNVLVDADYSQIELRLLAHMSGDETMKKAFREQEDIHTVTAAQVFGVPRSEVTPLMRSRAKAVNFGIIYGISAFSLSQDIGVAQSEAKTYIDAYLAKYDGVKRYMEETIKKAHEEGFVKTLFGRRRALPELKNANFNVRSFGERVARNMPIQGTAADIIKIAMVNAARRLKMEGLKARLILQVHDELIAECPEEEAERVKAVLSEEMDRSAELSVPLTADAKAGRSWAEAH